MNDDIRQQFPVSKNFVYLNHASVAPISSPVYEAMTGYERDLLENGFVHWREWGDEIERARGVSARFVNARPEEIAFVANTSTGLSYIANGIEWQSGDNIVTADCEFPSNQQPWFRLRKEIGVEVRQAQEREGRLDTDEILSLIDERTRVVTLSYVEFASGFRNDLSTIGKFCRARDVLFVVDAIQGLGALQLDVERNYVDAFSADAHKFLLGPEGVGLMYISERILHRIKPTVVGWTSVKHAFDFTTPDKEYADGARRFEPGTLNTAGIMGLCASIEMMLEIGPAKIESYLLELTDYLCEQLQRIDFQVVSSRRSGEASAVVACKNEKYAAQFLHLELEKQKIIVTPRLGRLRISPHFYNTREEINCLIESLATMSK